MKKKILSSLLGLSIFAVAGTAFAAISEKGVHVPSNGGNYLSPSAPATGNTQYGSVQSVTPTSKIYGTVVDYATDDNLSSETRLGTSKTSIKSSATKNQEIQLMLETSLFNTDPVRVDYTFWP
ncbi:hypothetical protein ACFSO0_02370 [Brevibacillus sp. GCM10020057]|uniref:hypothetical protein n=1 Tax=Brevibacillus sp. GCM10020057 TaxID=3317327 RepID=UPI00362D1441